MVTVGTAACLYFGPLAELVGRRLLVVTVHEFSGILLPVPLLLGLFSRSFRADLRRLNRFAPYDREWLRRTIRRLKDRPAGKFNAGEVIIDGCDITKLSTAELRRARSKWAMVFQYSALLDSLTVRENIALP